MLYTEIITVRGGGKTLHQSTRKVT